MNKKNENVPWNENQAKKIMRVMIDIGDIPGISESTIAMHIDEDIWNSAINEGKESANVLRDHLVAYILTNYVSCSEDPLKEIETKIHVHRLVDQFIQYTILNTMCEG